MGQCTIYEIIGLDPMEHQLGPSVSFALCNGRSQQHISMTATIHLCASNICYARQVQKQIAILAFLEASFPEGKFSKVGGGEDRRDKLYLPLLQLGGLSAIAGGPQLTLYCPFQLVLWSWSHSHTSFTVKWIPGLDAALYGIPCL